MAISTTTFVRIINGTEINTLGTITTVFNIGQSGASAYQSYLATTTDDPKLTEAEWSAGFVQLQSDWNQSENTKKDFIKNKPSIPTKTSELTNDSDFVSDANYVHTDNNYDDAAVAEVEKISDKQDVTDALLETDSNTIVGAINEVNSIAKGANQALSFDDYQAVIAAMLVSGLNAGQNLYIDKLDVPDLWVKAVETTSVPYTYVSDTQFVIDVLAGTQIGYYRLALLETQKVDLTNYYTKDETDQAIEDYAEPLRTTDQNYVSDAELEVLQDTSGVNTGDETQDTIGDLIELTELETVTDNTKIAASDSAFLKWFSGATLKTFLSLTYAKIVDYFSKTESDRRFVNQNGGTIYHITRWFTPTSALTIAANGLSATITSVQFNLGMTGAKLKLTGGINEPIITYVNSNTINLSFAVDSAFFGQSVAIADWGVYSIFSIFTNNDRYIVYNSTGDEVQIYTRTGRYFQSVSQVNDAFSFAASGLKIGSTVALLAAKSNVWYATIDTGFQRSAAGVWEINSGTAGVLRDLKLRSLYADKIIPNSDTTGVVIRNAADGADVISTANGKVTIIGTAGSANSFEIRNGNAQGTIKAGADVNSNTLTNNVRKLMRMTVPAYADITKQHQIFAADFDNATDSIIEFGGSNGGTQLGCTQINFNTVANNGDGGGILRAVINRLGRFGLNTQNPETTIDVNGTTTLRDWVYLNNGTHTGDAVGDRRFKVISGVLTWERCTVSHATKGSGTWVNSSNQLSANADAANANNVGCQRYRTDANNSYFEVCMQTGASTYAWVIIKQNTW